jgi:hypothetical protein
MNWQVDKTSIQFRMYRLQIAADQVKKGIHLVFVQLFPVIVPYLPEHQMTTVHGLQSAGKFLC